MWISADYDRMLDIDLRGVIHGTKHAIRAMIPTGGAVILNWASVAAFGAAKIWGPYSAGKAGIVAITKAAAVEYAGSGIRANVIAPGTITTESFAQMPAELLASIPPGKFGRTQEVAELPPLSCLIERHFFLARSYRSMANRRRNWPDFAFLVLMGNFGEHSEVTSGICSRA